MMLTLLRNPDAPGAPPRSERKRLLSLARGVVEGGCLVFLVEFPPPWTVTRESAEGLGDTVAVGDRVNLWLIRPDGERIVEQTGQIKAFYPREDQPRVVIYTKPTFGDPKSGRQEYALVLKAGRREFEKLG